MPGPLRPVGVYRATITSISNNLIYVSIPRLFPNRAVGPCLASDCSTELTTGATVLVGFLEGNTAQPVILGSFGFLSGTLPGGGSVPPTPVNPSSGTVVQEQVLSLQTGPFGGPYGSTSYGIMSPVFAITKQSAATRLVCEIGTSAWNYGTVNGLITIGISPTNNSADITVNAQYYFNAVGDHRHFTGLVSLSGRAAGVYNCTWWVKTAGTSTQYASDTNDVFWAKISEVW